ncbi:MAG: Sb-PDE family phosphodiesterase [Cytophagales bacterium]
MIRIKTLLLLVIISINYSAIYGQKTEKYTRKIFFPDIDGYKTLLTDFHQHTVFSDGSVWPTIRVEEAIKDGLDAISLTEHLEYQPYSKDIPNPDRNRAYNIAKSFAKNKNKSLDRKLIVINGQEITRSMPPGHINAIFLNDANKLLHPKDSIKGILAANKQDAFVFWNHPAWPAQRSDGIAKLDEFHKYLIEKKLLHGIEVVNELYYSEEALRLALENDLTIMGTSDIHGLIDWLFKVPDDNESSNGTLPGHRPVTIIFSKDKSEDGIKDALFAGRTAVFYNELLIGKEENLKPLVEKCLVINNINDLELGYSEDGKSTIKKVEIKNVSDAPFILKNLNSFTFETNSDIINIMPNSIHSISVKTKGEPLNELKFEVLNGIIAPKKYLNISLQIAK